MAARAFLALGLGAKESVSIYGFNSPEWVMADMAAIFAGGIGAGIYPTDTPKQVVYKARHSGAAIACVETLAKAMPFLENSKDLPRLKAVVIWDEAITTPEAIAELKKGLNTDIPPASSLPLSLHLIHFSLSSPYLFPFTPLTSLSRSLSHISYLSIL